ncbi:hypothetical protein EWM64_g1760 [Hericium alpestre]|uniref:SHSP domain-containing protein n=1 Tax=Hericium alpestre TaxID=135208 RepID=A0A4Z0A7D4_9AGAM|nr:hypothetical protein EWM64_g1760 [Hericium alpestre]
MHAAPCNAKDDYYRSWEAFDRIFTTQPSSATVRGDDAEDEYIVDRPMAPEPFSTPLNSFASTSSTEPETPADSDSLDRVWSEVRRKKERQMATQPSKVKSLEAWSASEQTPPAPTVVPPPRAAAAKPHLKRQKSNVFFKESRDGRLVTATFDLAGVKKEDMHVSFQADRLVVTWRTVRVTDRIENGTIFRDREEKKYSRTIPLPSGTKFEEVRASRDHRCLILTYPNMRAIRAKPRPVDDS